MTIGIYSLYWEEQDLIYIGQSQSIERRFTEHLWMLRKGTHTNYKVQRTYNLYGPPTTNILVECSIIELNQLEIDYTNEFNSLHKGLNIVEAGSNSYGAYARNSKYTVTEILKVFSLLYRTILSYRQISEKLHVSLSLVSDIASGNSHLWLQEKYPQQYAKIKDKARLRKSYKISSEGRGIVYPTIIDPSGTAHTVVSLREFCNTNTLLSGNCNAKKGINRVLLGIRKTYLGWKLKSFT